MPYRGGGCEKELASSGWYRRRLGRTENLLRNTAPKQRCIGFIRVKPRLRWAKSAKTRGNMGLALLSQRKDKR